jgi:prepilin-type N-terminal cleavage/methylation domain-containing protein
MRNRLQADTAGFTLIELLIVMLIISVLATFTVKGINTVRQKANVAKTKSIIDNINNGLVQYETEYGELPGSGLDITDPYDPRLNVISDVYRELKGRYLDVKHDDLGIEDPDPKKPPIPLKNTDIDVNDPDNDLLILDAWGNSLIAHENKSRQVKEDWMYREDFMDVYSKGPNGEDDSLKKALGEGGTSDDITNW